MRSPARRLKPRGSRRPGARRSRKLRLPRFSWPAIRGWPGRRLLGLARSWARLHAQTLVGSLGRLSDQPVATMMTVAVIGIALALPTALYLLLANLQSVSGHWDDSVELSVYLEPGRAEERARSLAEEIAGWTGVAGTAVITADEALDSFRSDSGLGGAVDALQRNPLPHLVIVRPAAGQADPDSVEALAQRLRGLPEADLVQADAEWVRRLFAILQMARRLALLAGALLAVGVLVIVGNTIRLDIQNRRDEIEVVKLIGGTDGFVRRPLLYSGAWYGLGGGLAALLVVQAGLWLLSGPAQRLAGLYGSGFRPEGLGFGGAVGLVLAGALLGWLGAWLSTTRHLRRLEPGF